MRDVIPAELFADDLDTGVYCLRNRHNGKRYVGSATVSLQRRMQQHRSALRNGNHPNGYLQNSWDKHDGQVFVFEVIEECVPELCLVREQFWMDYYRSYLPENGYNICAFAGHTTGYRFPEEVRARVTANNRRTRKDPKLRAKLSAATQQNWDDPEKRRKMEQANRDRITPECRKKMSESHKRRYGKVGERRRRSEEQEKMWQDSEYRAKLVAAHRGKKASAETRRKMRLSQQARRKREKEAEQ